MIKKRLIYCLLIFVLVVSVSGCATVNTQSETKKCNPHVAEWLDGEMVESLDSIKRIDEKGALYEIDYTADYYGPVIAAVLKQASAAVSSGCSAFSTCNPEGEFLLCRNYDYRHKDAEDNWTGLNVITRTAPEGKLKSIGVCDACWLNTSAYFSGTLDDGVTDISAMVLAPYMCVDGINEAGLTASLLIVDTKEGESLINQNTGKEKVILPVLLRYIIDNAHDVEEAIEIAKSFDVCSSGGSDLHMYINDKSGVSAVLEWRQCGNNGHELYVTYTNAVTNFFVGFDDAGDVYNDDGSLKELYCGLNSTFNDYKYGYGHGFHRFNAIVATLERFIGSEENGHGIRNSFMDESQALDILRVVSQNPGTEKTSFTQYSAIYNLEELSVTYYMQRDYERSYTFSLNNDN